MPNTRNTRNRCNNKKIKKTKTLKACPRPNAMTFTGAQEATQSSRDHGSHGNVNGGVPGPEARSFFLFWLDPLERPHQFRAPRNHHLLRSKQHENDDQISRFQREFPEKRSNRMQKECSSWDLSRAGENAEELWPFPNQFILILTLLMSRSIFA